MKIYIDIDGVLLTRNLAAADYGAEFIEFLVSNFDCYWLTTHCRKGENKSIQYLSQFYPKNVVSQLKNIRPTNWDSKKTEAIDFSSPFIWLDDHPFEVEKAELLSQGCFSSLFIIDLSKENELLRVKQEIISKLNKAL